MKIAILDDYLDCARQLAPFGTLEQDGHVVTVFTEKLHAGDLAEVLREFDVLCVMRERTAFPAELIRQLPALKLIITTGRRNDVIDLEACKSAKITVCGTDSPAHGTAELTLGLIIAAAKGLIVEHNSMHSGGWQTGLAGDLKGSTLGVIGLGRLGGLLARYGQMLDMNVIAWSTNLSAEHAAACGVEKVSKDELMSRSDYITIHLRLSERTHHLIKAADLARMKPGACIVNTSRAQIIEMEALLAELEAGRISACLDVFETEPLPADNKLRSLPNVILSPHKGYASRDTFKVFYNQTYQTLLAWMDNKPINLIS